MRKSRTTELFYCGQLESGSNMCCRYVQLAKLDVPPDCIALLDTVFNLVPCPPASFFFLSNALRLTVCESLRNRR